MSFTLIRNLFLGIVLVTIIETSFIASVTLETKNPPRFHNSIVSTIQSYSIRP
ncbi:hypothetical protein [Metabacillus bambusae]|uniref:Uncharacterized protein n=1 Tax=Metabacillus bambusae TaxID=2795218 RepID=A0ABS3MYF8_9BACI|nr:hypothetical protein [Metabacillus bambusae]MBO1510743.1 hypothetical protein [Metabacillus bambusae]